MRWRAYPACRDPGCSSRDLGKPRPARLQLSNTAAVSPRFSSLLGRFTRRVAIIGSGTTQETEKTQLLRLSFQKVRLANFCLNPFTYEAYIKRNNVFFFCPFKSLIFEGYYTTMLIMVSSLSRSMRLKETECVLQKKLSFKPALHKPTEVNNLIYYSTIMSFYHVRSKEQAKYEAVIHRCVLV